MATSDTSSTATSPTNAAVVTGPVVTTENSTFSRLGHALSLVQQIEALGEDRPASIVPEQWPVVTCKKDLNISEMLSRNKNKRLTAVVPRTQGERFRYLLVCWMATANIPFAAMENKYYRQILQLFNAPLTDALLPKGGDTTRSWLTSMYHDLLDSIKVKLEASPHQKHLSFDLWTSSHGLALLAVVVHYFESSGNYQTHLLTLSRITGTHAGENIAPAIALKCKVRVRCFGHILNLVAKAFLQATNKKLIKSLAPESLAHHNAAEEGRLLQEWRKSGPIGKLHFLVHHIRRSPQRRDLFSDIAKGKLTEEEQQEFGAILIDKDIAKLQLRSDNETRWHSVYHMIDRAIMLRDPLDYFVNIVTKKDPDNITSDDQLTPSEWVVLKEIRCILEPFKIITKKFEGRKPNFADVVSHAYTLHRNLNELYQQYARTASQHHDFHGGPWVGIRPPSPALGNSLNPGRMQSLSSDPDPDIEPPVNVLSLPSQRRSGRTIRPPAHLDDFEVDLPAFGYRPSTAEPHPAPSPRPQQRVVQLGEVIDDEVDDTGYAFIQKNDPLKSSDIQARFRVFFDHNYPRPAPDSSNGSRDRPSHRPAFGYDFYDPPDRVSVDEIARAGGTPGSGVTVGDLLGAERNGSAASGGDWPVVPPVGTSVTSRIACQLKLSPILQQLEPGFMDKWITKFAIAGAMAPSGQNKPDSKVKIYWPNHDCVNERQIIPDLSSRRVARN
ncbi:hypothetical protein CHGG_10718 [Chaetomium globosum CBS 148.51]|uniref:HAT C-terminal dimerisation domain-containing protein n=1 Tax=Chaetomium globosum (strain ATCC 6205 / CBS 148.51 / DSM 1962 / NBRC 6347 / NRRL 1970) TaxID=306901 RepID=Q2GMT6_CHAGB|nr:uncharacterized protein CHGG_10718 [Chaetomium globosum CBS 148.51]EAQ84314.1 hypothetical protein CHGG_10718 [Chaetomium globosum CBS 148.51]